MIQAFSRESYAQLLALARACGYAIRPLRQAFAAADGPVLLLRHDVDLSLRLALQMAELERELGVRSSYFILPHNDFYAPFSPGGRRLLTALVALGHEVGLHWDSSVYPAEPAAFRASVRRDLDMLEDITGTKIVSASQHNPIDTSFRDLGGLVEIEAYAPDVRERYAYVSDSAMTWRSGPPDGLIEQRKNVQFLAHPVWWMAAGATREEKLGRLIESESELRKSQMAEFLAYIDRCLADRERLDAQLRETWQRREARATG